MRLEEWAQAVNLINGYWPYRDLNKQAVAAWWERLRDYPVEDVKVALAKLAEQSERRPSLSLLLLTTRGVKADRRRKEELAPVRVPRPSRCQHELREGVAGKPPVVCRGMVSWVDAGEGWVLGCCSECGREYAEFGRWQARDVSDRDAG